MKVKWEKRKVLVPTCPKCKEELQGDNSYAFPYQCSCGVWKSDWINPTDYKIMIKAE